jgi:hypothetical protein
MNDLIEAITDGEEVYMNVSERVLNECREVETELSTTSPGILKLLSPLLVAEFLEVIDYYYYSLAEYIYIL